MTEPPDDRLPQGAPPPPPPPPIGEFEPPVPPQPGYPGAYPYGYPPPAGGYPPYPQYQQYQQYQPGGYPPGYPYAPPPQPTRRISAGMVILGLVLGSVGWLALFIATAALLDRFFDVGSQPSAVAVSLFWMAAGAALLIFPKTRQAGAGLLLGLSIGVIVWAGLCAALLQ